jgi:hypothetical protein
MQAAAPSAGPMVVPSHAVCEHAARQFWEQHGDILIAGEREWPALVRQLVRNTPASVPAYDD